MRYKSLLLSIASLVALSVLVSCSKPDAVPIQVDLLNLVILEHKDETNHYNALIQREGKLPIPYSPIKEIAHFDEIYKEGNRYYIVVKRVRTKGETSYIWTGKYWNK